MVTNINIFGASMGTRVLSYRNYTLIIAIDDYYFKLRLILVGAYRAKKTSKLNYFLRSLSLFDIFGFVYRECDSSLPFR